MSNVKLVTFAVYTCPTSHPKSASQVKIIAGASRAEINPKGKLELTITSVPMRSKAMQRRTPDGAGLLMLYGLRDTTVELQRMRAEARQLGANFAFANIEVEVGDIEVGLVDYPLLKTAKDMRFVSVRRMKKDLQLQVLDTFARHTASDKSASGEDLKRVFEIATRPDLWTQLFADKTFADQKDNAFKKLRVLVIPLADDPATAGSLRHVAFVRPGANITSIVQGSDHVELVLPDWMKKKT